MQLGCSFEHSVPS